MTQAGSIKAAAVSCSKAASRDRRLLADSVEKVGHGFPQKSTRLRLKSLF
jgi:hypothetical protein